MVADAITVTVEVRGRGGALVAPATATVKLTMPAATAASMIRATIRQALLDCTSTVAQLNGERVHVPVHHHHHRPLGGQEEAGGERGD